jgi:hypothetical protein
MRALALAFITVGIVACLVRVRMCCVIMAVLAILSLGV